MGVLRFYLAMCVVMAHVASYAFPIGISPHSAVMIFFIISGFYMTMILNKTYVGQGSYLAFYFSRFFRLWPIFIIITIISILAPLLLPHYPDNPNNWIWPAIHNGSMPLGPTVGILFSNFFMILHDWQFYFSRDVSHGFTLISGFSGGTDLGIYDYVPQAWSIGVEISFYMLAPLLVRNMRTILVVAMCSLLINLYWIHVGARFDPWHYMFLPSVLYLFMMGAAMYHICFKRWLSHLLWKDTSLAILSLIILVFVSSKINADRPLYIAYEPLKFFYYAIAIPLLFVITKNWRIDRFIGELSYPLYLCHLLVLHIVRAIDPNSSSTLVIMISIVASIALVLLVDFPINAWRHKMSERMMKNREICSATTPTLITVLQ